MCAVGLGRLRQPGDLLPAASAPRPQAHWLLCGRQKNRSVVQQHRHAATAPGGPLTHCRARVSLIQVRSRRRMDWAAPVGLTKRRQIQRMWHSRTMSTGCEGCREGSHGWEKTPGGSRRRIRRRCGRIGGRNRRRIGRRYRGGRLRTVAIDWQIHTVGLHGCWIRKG